MSSKIFTFITLEDIFNRELAPLLGAVIATVDIESLIMGELLNRVTNDGDLEIDRPSLTRLLDDWSIPTDYRLKFFQEFDSRVETILKHIDSTGYYTNIKLSVYPGYLVAVDYNY